MQFHLVQNLLKTIFWFKFRKIKNEASTKIQGIWRTYKAQFCEVPGH